MSLLTITASNKNRLDINNISSQYFIKSIQWQSFTDFELLIADGGSDNYDELKKYFNSFNGPIKMNLVQHKIGDVFLRALLNNVGIRNSKTPYILCTDVDMLFAKDFVKTVVSKLNENNFVESRTMYWKSKFVNKIYSGEIDPYNNINDCKKGRIKKRTTAGGCQCAHINVWNKIRGFDERYYGWGSEDYDLLTRVIKCGINVEWIGESLEEIMLFHQPHERNVTRDLVFQEENKKILHSIKEYKVNQDGWGGIKS